MGRGSRATGGTTHDNGRHDDGKGRHDDGKRQQGDRRHVIIETCANIFIASIVTIVKRTN